MENLEQLEQQETLPPQPSSKKKYLVIGIIIAVIIGVVILVLFIQKEAPLPTPEVIAPDIVAEGETENWQAYRSEEFGFEVKYPSFLKFEDAPSYCAPKAKKAVRLSYEYFYQRSPTAQSLFTNLGLVVCVLEDDFSFVKAQQLPLEKEELVIDEHNAFTKSFKDGEDEGEWYYIEKDSNTIIQFRFDLYNEGFNEVPSSVDQGEEFLPYVEQKEMVDQILSTFRFIESLDFSSLCVGTETLLSTTPLEFDGDPEEETLVVCKEAQGFSKGLSLNISEEKDGELVLLWSKGLSASKLGTYPDYGVVDANKDGVDEMYWAQSLCGGSCTGCSTVYNLYSLKLEEWFSREERSEFNKTCTEIIDLPTEYSPNLGQPEFKLFKDYLDERVFSRV